MAKSITNDISITFYHPSIENLSDGTLRKLIREFSKLTREVLLTEVDLLMSEMPLSYSERQSMKTLVERDTVGGPNFYVEKIEKGSFILVGGLATTAILALLDNLVKNNYRFKFKRGDEEGERHLQEAYEKVRDYIKERPKRLYEDILAGLINRIMGGRFKIVSVDGDFDDNKNNVKMELGTVGNVENKQEEKNDSSSVLDEILKRLEEMKEKPKRLPRKHKRKGKR